MCTRVLMLVLLMIINVDNNNQNYIIIMIRILNEIMIAGVYIDKRVSIIYL